MAGFAASVNNVWSFTSTVHIQPYGVKIGHKATLTYNFMYEGGG